MTAGHVVGNMDVTRNLWLPVTRQRQDSCHLNCKGMQTYVGSKLRVGLLAVLHQLFCPYGIGIIVPIITFTAVGAFHGHAKTASYVLTGTPFFPLQIAAGLIIGYCAGRFFHWPLTGWTWVLPALLLGLSIIFIRPAHGTSIWGYWFGWSGASGRAFPPLQPGLTMPVYLSAAYSIAATIGQLTMHNSE